MPEIPRHLMAWTAGVLLTAYAFCIMYALAAPGKQHDPQRGQAIGCLMIVLIGLMGLGAMLAAGVLGDIGPLVRVPFWMAASPVISLIGGSVYYLLRKGSGR